MKLFHTYLKFHPKAGSVFLLVFSVIIIIYSGMIYGIAKQLPRFVSIKATRANMRIGPGMKYHISWLYLRKGLPMEVIQEYGNWRKVRDSQGNEGWMARSLLSEKRTAMIAPWSSDDTKKLVNIYNKPNKDSSLIAKLEPGVIVLIKSCDNNWCYLNADNVKGYILIKNIWGVYPGEIIDQ